MIQCYISVSCKSMWISWISSSFKGEINPSVQRCFQSVQWLSNVSLWPVLFKEQGSIKVWSCLWKWIMSLSKEIIEDLGKRVDVAHHARKSYKTISKEFELQKSTIGQIVYKWKKLHIHTYYNIYTRGRPIIGADIKHFTDYRYRPFSKHICWSFFFIIIIFL